MKTLALALVLASPALAQPAGRIIFTTAACPSYGDMVVLEHEVFAGHLPTSPVMIDGVCTVFPAGTIVFVADPPPADPVFEAVTLPNTQQRWYVPTGLVSASPQ